MYLIAIKLNVLSLTFSRWSKTLLLSDKSEKKSTFNFPLS